MGAFDSSLTLELGAKVEISFKKAAKSNGDEGFQIFNVVFTIVEQQVRSSPDEILLIHAPKG